jgi:hypothetical protein
MNISLSRLATAAAIVTCGFFNAPKAYGTVIGTLQLGSGADTVTVSATNITWNGPFSVSGGTTLTYNAGTPLPISSTGTIMNLVAPTTFPVIDFLSFTAAPALFFDLSTIGPGSASTNCAAATHIGDSCSAFAGSPFILTLTATGTTVELSGTGLATDSTPNVSKWIGQFQTTITTLSTVPAGQIVTPLNIQNFFATPGAAIVSPYSGTFVATFTPVPESSTLAMMFVGSGLILASVVRRRKQRR